jgi:D-glycero-alpha-D-manno-heptose-7-phosphate kinase
VAVCAALADWRRVHYEPEALLQIAMNVEAQAINVPTGLQDYRPALYGGIAALELEVDGVHRVPLQVDLKELQRRIVLCYTASHAIRGPITGRSPRSTSTAINTSSTASNGFAIRLPRCGRR